MRGILKWHSQSTCLVGVVTQATLQHIMQPSTVQAQGVVMAIVGHEAR
jgi:hypothetical protein